MPAAQGHQRYGVTSRFEHDVMMSSRPQQKPRTHGELFHAAIPHGPPAKKPKKSPVRWKKEDDVVLKDVVMAVSFHCLPCCEHV
jgi:hypothetical protein